MILIISLTTYSQTSEYKYAAKSESSTTQKISSIATSKTQETKPTASLYQGIRISVKDEKDYLKATLEKYGMSDKYDVVDYIINGESTWQWFAFNEKSAGLLAFTAETWASECKDFGAYDLNPFRQIDCGVMLMNKGQWWRWDVFCLKWYNQDCVDRRHLQP